MKKRPTLDDQHKAAKAAYEAAVKDHGARSIRAGIAAATLRDLTNRILRRDLRRNRTAA